MERLKQSDRSLARLQRGRAHTDLLLDLFHLQKFGDFMSDTSLLLRPQVWIHRERDNLSWRLSHQRGNLLRGNS